MKNNISICFIITLLALTSLFSQQKQHWTSSVLYQNYTDSNFYKCDFIKNGIMKLPARFTFGSFYFTQFWLIDTLCLIDNFSVEVKIKNTPSENGISCYDIYFCIYGLNNSHLLSALMGSNSCQSYSGIDVNGYYILNSPQLIFDSNNWNIYKYKFKNNVLNFSINDINRIALPYEGNFCYITNIFISLKGNGSVDWIKVYDENDSLYYYEEFLDCNNLVSPPPCQVAVNPSLVITQNSPLCEGDTLFLDANSSDNNVEYHWTGPNGFTSIEKSPSIPDVRENMSGDYECKIINKGNCTNGKNKTTVRIYQKPTVTLNCANSNPCNEDSTLIIIINYNSKFHYKWSTGDTLQNLVVRKSGDYYVDVTDSNGCTGKSNIISVNFNSVSVSISCNNTNPCIGDSTIIVIDNYTIENNYKWSTGDTTQIIVVTDSGFYYVDITDSNGCKGRSNLIQINYRNSIPVSISCPDTNPCQGDSALIIINNFNPIYHYSWSIGESTQNIYAKSSGNYYVEVTDSNGCKNMSNIITINFSNEIPVLISCSTYKPCYGDSVSITIDNYNPKNKYKWSTGDSSISITVKETGQYYVEVIDENGCKGKSNIIKVEFLNISDVTISCNNPNPCKDDSAFIKIDNYNPKFKYRWSTGDSSESIYAKTPGNYDVEVIDSNGCKGKSNIININFNELQGIIIENEPPDTLIFDSVGVGGITYKKIKIRNPSKDTLEINNVILFRNIEFSIPQSQLPLILLPSEIKELTVYFATNKFGVHCDTLFLSGLCVDIKMILIGISTSNQSSGLSKCNIPITIRTISDSQKIIIEPPNPNPITNSVNIIFTIVDNNLENNNLTEEQIKCELIDFLGSKININYNVELIRTNNLVSGKISGYLKNYLSNGYYILRCKLIINNTSFSQSFPILLIQ
ncbi:MAG: hypothetical protein EPN82_11270 [Bacteroidetes bacterium]|nr:MAG: hypothetical protein EPN82_11270 [Bacteroidota bacterium]